MHSTCLSVILATNLTTCNQIILTPPIFSAPQKNQDDQDNKDDQDNCDYHSDQDDLDDQDEQDDKTYPNGS